MEWVEVTGKTVEEAKEAALDQLGVDRDEAEFEVLEEPRPGLFGRLRSEARVRARVMPTSPRPKIERRERARGRGRGAGAGASGGDGRVAGAGGGGAGGGRASGRGGRGEGSGSGGRGGGGGANRREGERRVTDDEGADDMDQVHAGDDEAGDGVDDVELAEDFLRGLVEAFGATCSIERRALEDGLTELSVHGDDLGLLIGPRGTTLSAVQELTRTAVQRRPAARTSRLIIDIAGYRQARRVALERFANEVAAQVIASGVPSVLEPMPPADRKVVHDAINAIDGVTTSSEGEEPHRRVVISPVPPA